MSNSYWWWRKLARLRKPQTLPSEPTQPTEPLGLICIGTARIPVDKLTLRAGTLEVSGEKKNPLPDGERGAGWPRTYQLLCPDGTLAWEAQLPNLGTSTPDMNWRFTFIIDLASRRPHL